MNDLACFKGPCREAVYDVIHVADFRSKRHFGQKSSDYVTNKYNLHLSFEFFCLSV